jgi:hypothetical protein
MAQMPEQLSCYPNDDLAASIQESADDKDISVSKWLLEAARQKLQTEK